MDELCPGCSPNAQPFHSTPNTMNFELTQELFREHLSAKGRWLPEGTLYAHSMLLYRSLPSLVSQQFDLALMAPDFGGDVR